MESMKECQQFIPKKL